MSPAEQRCGGQWDEGSPDRAGPSEPPSRHPPCRSCDRCARLPVNSRTFAPMTSWPSSLYLFTDPDGMRPSFHGRPSDGAHFPTHTGQKERFQRSRDVGCDLGLRPKRSQSGDCDPQLDITKAGNGYLRQLLVECANHVIGRHGKDSALRPWGLSLGGRGGSHARRAIVAVAR